LKILKYIAKEAKMISEKGIEPFFATLIGDLYKKSGKKEQIIF